VLLHVTVDSYQPLVVAGSDCIDCSETMKRVSRLRVLGISIIFLGSEPCRAFVGHNGNVNARENAKLTRTGRPSRERTLASRRLERGDSMLTCRPRRRLCFWLPCNPNLKPATCRRWKIISSLNCSPPSRLYRKKIGIDASALTLLPSCNTHGYDA
jgi:hypothetical protein